MARPQIEPRIFIALQNGLAALLFALLLGAELVRRELYAHPQLEILWRLSTLADRTVMPVLKYVDQLLPTPDMLLIGLMAGLVIPLLAWWTRYWFATALAGHITFAALVVITFSIFRRGNLAFASLDLPEVMAAVRPGLIEYALLALTLFVLVMCIADHVAFVRYLATLRQHFARKK
jgi:hypothetical protein